MAKEKNNERLGRLKANNKLQFIKKESEKHGYVSKKKNEKE